ncbi:secreted protein [Helicobacter canis]|uniref:Secreted protein n=2 Tax=Helicobacter canis TaxID=29419 RepID=A0A377JL84_9HELI|nr:secreted protein [Helicobacter canis]
MPLFGLRPVLASFPIPKGKKASEITIISNNKILGLLPRDNALVLKYGNNVMTKILPKRVELYQDQSSP